MMNSEQKATSQEVKYTPFRKLQICICEASSSQITENFNLFHYQYVNTMMNSEQNAVSQEVRNTPFRKLQICILILIVRHWANIMSFVAVRSCVIWLGF